MAKKRSSLAEKVSKINDTFRTQMFENLKIPLSKTHEECAAVVSRKRIDPKQKQLLLSILDQLEVLEYSHKKLTISDTNSLKKQIQKINWSKKKGLKNKKKHKLLTRLASAFKKRKK